MSREEPKADEILDGRYESVLLGDVHLGSDGKDIWVGTLKDIAKKGETPKPIWDKRKSCKIEFLAVLFRMCPIGFITKFSGGGKTFAVKITEDTKIVKGDFGKGGS